ncbi:MAG: ImmA/IrrE family metallo-endopeptidase [Clostridium fessum]|jgi:Zn-dependent peptidase ImmA (M78 family)
MDIKKKADSLVRKHQTRNPFEIIQGMNVIVVFAPLCGVRGFYQYFQRNNIIYIDENLPEHEKKFVCAHELGHMLLHKKANALFMDSRTHLNTHRYEVEADMFAMDLLIDDDMIAEYKPYTVDQISHLLGYRKELIELRLK